MCERTERPREPHPLPTALSLGDPLAFGIAAARSDPSAASSAFPSSRAQALGEGQEGHREGMDVDTASDADDIFGDLAPGDVEDIVDAKADALGIAEESGQLPDGEQSAGAQHEGPEDLESDAEAEAAALAAATAAPPHLPSSADYVANCDVSASGYVTTSLPPLSGVAIVGRITSWPAHKPEMSRSVSCRCYLHPGCTSPAKSRRAMPNEVLLRWLFAGEHLPEGTAAEKKAAGREHMRLFAQIAADPSK